MKATAFGVADPKELWKQWFDATTVGWRKVPEMGTDPLELTTQWLEMMEEVRAKRQAEYRGEKDHICTLPQAKASMGLVTSEVKEFFVLDAGHVGLPTGSRSPRRRCGPSCGAG